MPVTFSLPTVLARLADGQATIKATGETLGDVVAEIAGRYPRLAPRLRDFRARWPDYPAAPVRRKRIFS